MSRRRHWATAFKAAVTLTLLVYLFRSGSLDPSAMGLLATNPVLAAATVINWVLVSAVLGAWRYRTLLFTVNIHLDWMRALHLQLSSLFLNTVVPGSIGGDVWKSLAVAKHHSERKRTLLFLLLVERGIGLSALLAASSLIWLLTGRWGSDAVQPDEHLTLLFIVLSAGLVGLPVAMGLLIEWKAGWIRLGTISGKFSWLGKLLEGAEVLRGHRRHLIGAYVISMAMHSISIGYFFLLTRAFPEASLDVQAVATVFPIGILSVMLPVSLAGLGVGHLAFETLFASMGAKGGANVFNLYILGQVGPNLLGAIPFVVVRNHAQIEKQP
ncbi:hypothetical protein NBRC116584_31430 [Hydrogenophaga sp. 5NK40-0174]